MPEDQAVKVLSPLRGSSSFDAESHGLRRGLHSYAASRLGLRSPEILLNGVRGDENHSYWRITHGNVVPDPIDGG